MSSLIAKTITMKPAPENPALWCCEIVGHSSNEWPRIDDRWTSSQRYESRFAAEGSIIRECFSGMIRGENVYAKFVESLWYGALASDIYKRYSMLEKLRSRLFDAHLAVDPRFSKREGIEKDAAKAERIAHISGRIGARMEKLCELLAAERRTIKPDKAKYYIQVFKEGVLSDAYLYSYSERRFRYGASLIYAKKFSRLAAEKIKSSLKSYRPKLIPASA